MKKIRSITVFTFLTISLAAQSVDLGWVVPFGGMGTDVGISITTDVAGNIYTAGYFFETVDFDPGAGVVNLTSFGSGDIFICKLDPAGNLVWVKQMGGTGIEDARSIVVDGSGNVYTTGKFTGTADFDPGTGTFNLTSNGDDDIFISKLDASGNFVWAKQMGGTSFDIGQSLMLDASENVVSTGYFFGTVDFDPGSGTSNLAAVGSHDIYISKLDPSGNFLWAKNFGGLSIDFGISLGLDPSGNIYTSGHFRDVADFDPGAGVFNLTSEGEQDIFVSKLDPSGNFLWAKQMGGLQSEAGQALAVDATGNVYTTGYFSETVDFDPGAGTFSLTSAGNQDIFINKLDASGNFVWTKQIGGSNYDEGSAIAVDAVGDVYLSGGFSMTVDFDPGSGTFDLVSEGGTDIFVSKLNASGDFVWAAKMGASQPDQSISIAVDAIGNVFTTGFFQGTVDFDPGTGTFDLTSAGNYDAFVHKLRLVPLNLNEEETFNAITVFPNPTAGEISLDLGSLTNVSIRILTADGKLIFEKNNAHGVEQFEINNDPGIYFIEVLSQKEKATFKLVKL